MRIRKTWYVVASGLMLLLTINLLGFEKNEEEQKSSIKIEYETKQLTPLGLVKNQRVILPDDISSYRKKIIYTYGKIFGATYWWDTPPDFDFTELDGAPCEVSHCKVVYDYSYLKIADAVLFHAAELPPVDELKLLATPLKQVWVWMTSESPLHYHNEHISFKEYNGIFNWTGTYRMDSTIWTPYYLMLPLKHSDPRPDANKNYAQGKTKMIIAIISNNCNSYRIDFIRKLKQYINVDLYGKCKEEVNPDLPSCEFHSPECLMLQSQYKFTLSLENAFCKDYVTEKFYVNGLKRGNVPIVLNNGNLTNPRVAPPNSFINILDFKDMESLAKHIKEIASNDEKYNKYHEWRNHYKVGTQNRMCSTCKELWKEEILKHRTKINQVRNGANVLENYWSFDKTCNSYDEKLFQNFLK